MVQRFTTARFVDRAWLLVAMVTALAGPGALGLRGVGGSFASRPAFADRETADAARIDWAAGRITAGGTSVADRHAPSPAVARGTSRRGAEDAARQRIAAALPSLPLAGGGTLANRLADPAVKARIDAVIAAARSIAAEPETDGSWHVTLAVPLEAIRIAIDQPRALAPSGDTGPAIVVVDAPSTRPALGWRIAGTAAATLWVPSVPGWASSAPRITARPDRAGELVAAANPGTPASLYVVVSGPPSGSSKPRTR